MGLLGKVKKHASAGAKKMQDKAKDMRRAQKKDENDADPDHSIEPWCDHFIVKLWVDKKQYPNCRFCDVTFTGGHKHHCRLCGHMFCSACTSKKHVPDKFKVKKKAGPVRVCHTCRDDAVAQAKTQGVVIKTETIKTVAEGRVRIHPPEWDDEQAYADCYKCKITVEKKKYNCRTCGHLFCGRCTQKMEVPQAFRKKAKTGPVRVCDMCRYAIVSGAILDESARPVGDDESPLPPPPPEDEDGNEVLDTGLFEAMSFDTTGAPPSGSDDDSSESDDEDDFAALAAKAQQKHGVHKALFSEPPGYPTSTGSTLNIIWEGRTEKYTLTIAWGCDSLLNVDAVLRRQEADLKDIPFDYVFRSQPVPKAHWKVFKVHLLLPQLVIKDNAESRAFRLAAQKARQKAIADEKEKAQRLAEQRKAGGPPPGATKPATKKQVQARAKFDYVSKKEGAYLSLTKGEILTITDRKSEQWWWALRTGADKGWVPASYVELLEDPDQDNPAELPNIPDIDEVTEKRIAEGRKRVQKAKETGGGGFKRPGVKKVDSAPAVSTGPSAAATAEEAPKDAFQARAQSFRKAELITVDKDPGARKKK